MAKARKQSKTNKSLIKYPSDFLKKKKKATSDETKATSDETKAIIKIHPS